MSIALTIFLGYAGLFILLFILIWWAYKRSQRNEPSKPPINPLHYPHTIPPSQRDLEVIECSVDVIAIDKEGVMFIGFYNYDDLGWVFIHDFFEPDGDFVWMYAPENFHP